jgi:hypothetical protein
MQKEVNNNIEEHRVGFPNAKLLKEKGFGVKCTHRYFHNSDLITTEESTSKFPIINAPTQQVAIDWIRINFELEVNIESCTMGFYVFIYNRKTYSKIILQYFHNIFETPEEAKESAINHVLNLIK